MSTLLHNLPWPFLATAVLLLGCIVGSFLNVVIHRFPVDPEELLDEEADPACPACGEAVRWLAFTPVVGGLLTGGRCHACHERLFPAVSLASPFERLKELGQEGMALLKTLSWPGSHCPQCQAPIHWYDNFPILSFVVLGGKCRSCRSPIRWRYPIVEAATGLVWAALMLREGPSWRFVGEAALCSALWVLFWIDLDRLILPDLITFPLILMGVAFQGLTQHAWAGSLLAAGGGYLTFLAIELVGYLWLRKPAMGRGDAKLAAVLGAWLGGTSLVVALFMSFLAGSLIGIGLLLIRRESKHYPFGPSMVLGAIAGLFFGEAIARWYLSLLAG